MAGGGIGRQEGGDSDFCSKGGSTFCSRRGEERGLIGIFGKKIFNKKLNFNNLFEAYVCGFSPRKWGEISGD